MIYFNCSVYPDEVGKPMEDSCEIIVRADTFQHLIEKMDKFMNRTSIYDRFCLNYMSSTENGIYVLNFWRLNAIEFADFVRRNLYV